MFVYNAFEPGCYTVGHYDPSGKWHPESDHPTSQDAAERCNFLNGGKDNGTDQRRHDYLKSLDDYDRGEATIEEIAIKKVAYLEGI